MTVWNRVAVAAVGIAVAIVALESASWVSGARVPGVVTEAHAVVGRPLTPVSVAGVGRRTARRCAAGVYNC